MKPVKFVLMLPVTFIGLLVVTLIFTVLNKAFWDARVRYLCANEGGVTVYETVDLSAPEYASIPIDIYGTPFIPSEDARGINDPFYVVSSSDLQQKTGGIEILKNVFDIVRSSDRKSLGTAVSYVRRGGDLVTFGSPGTGFSCSNIQGFGLDLHGQIFK